MNFFSSFMTILFNLFQDTIGENIEVYNFILIVLGIILLIIIMVYVLLTSRQE